MTGKSPVVLLSFTPEQLLVYPHLLKRDQGLTRPVELACFLLKRLFLYPRYWQNSGSEKNSEKKLSHSSFFLFIIFLFISPGHPLITYALTAFHSITR